MQKKFFQTQEFRELAKEWELKLKQAEFVDIEEQIGNDRFLKQNASNCYSWHRDPIKREAKEQYFRFISSYVENAVFDNEIDKKVMQLTAMGETIIGISRVVDRDRRTVRFIIRKHENRWGIRTWRPDQLKKRWKPKTPTP